MKVRGSRFLVAAVLAALLSACASPATKLRLDRPRLLQPNETVDGAGSGLHADTLRGTQDVHRDMQGVMSLSFITNSIYVAPNYHACALAACGSEDRIVNCGALSAPPTISMLTGVMAFRHPEDDPTNVLVTDSCVACYSNVSESASLTITARATCLVGGRTGAFVARGQEGGAETIAPGHPYRNGDAELGGNRLASSERFSRRPRGPRGSRGVRMAKRRWRRKLRGRRPHSSFAAARRHRPRWAVCSQDGRSTCRGASQERAASSGSGQRAQGGVCEVARIGCRRVTPAPADRWRAERSGRALAARRRGHAMRRALRSRVAWLLEVLEGEGLPATHGCRRIRGDRDTFLPPL